MNQLDTFSIGFGNTSGQTVKVLLQEKKNIIEISNMKATHVEAPKIRVKEN